VRLKWLGCFFILLLTLILSACSNLILGGNSNKPGGPQPTSLAVITTANKSCTAAAPCGMVKGSSTPLPLQAIGTFPGGSTQNLTSTAKWTASSNIVTLGLSTTTPIVENVTAVAAGTVTITATSTNNLTATATIIVNPASLSTVTVTPLGDGLAVGATANYVATANFSDGSTQNVTTSSTSWATSTSGVATVGAATGVVKAVAAGQTDVSATYLGVTGSTALNVVAAPAPFSNASLNGNYAFTLTTTTTNSAKQSVPKYFVGSLTFNGAGKITAGTMDTAGDAAKSTSVTGSVSVFADGRGTLTLNATGLPSSTYRLILTSSLSGKTSGQFVQFDGKGTAIGTLVQQASGAIIGANEVFRLTGVDTGANPLGEVGVFSTSGTSIASGEFDENDFGVIDAGTTTPITISGGSYTAPASNGRGTLKLTTNTTTSNFVFYATQSGSLLLVSSDSPTSAPTLLGYAEEQTGPFTTGTLATGYGYLLERPPATGRGTFDTIGRVAFTGLGTLSGGLQDEVSGASNDQICNPPPSNCGTYSVASNGRAPISAITTLSGTLNYIYYLVSAKRAYVIETNDSYAAVGTVDEESSVNLTDSDLSGSYGFTAADLSQASSTSMVGWISASGSGSLQGVGDVATGSSLTSSIISSTYSVPAIGRTTIVPSAPVGAESYIFYVVSPCESYMLGVVPSFDGTVLNQSSSSCP
jgi:hypothetical protein